MSEATEVAVKDHTMKDLKDEYPGKMALAETRGTYSGCSVKVFSASTGEILANDINDFFKANSGLLVVDLKFATDPSGYSALVTFTAQADGEYIAAIARFGEEIQRKLAEEKAAELEAEANAAEQVEDAQQKVAALAEVGRKCQSHHAPVLEENKKLRKELDALRKKAKR